MALTFFSILNKQPKLTICCGFNSNQGQFDDSYMCGYDLPFILDRLNSKVTKHYTKLSYFGRDEQMICRLNITPKILYMDMKTIFHNKLKFSEMKLTGYKLDDFLSALGIK